MPKDQVHRRRHLPRRMPFDGPLPWCRLALLPVLLLAACATPVKEFHAPYWPSLPDRPRFQYELTLRSDAALAKHDATSRFKALVTGQTSDATITLQKPFDVAAEQGRIIISDTVARIVYLFDVPRRSVFVFGSRGPGKLGKPLGVAIDHNINYYVVDGSTKSVSVYNPDGHFQRRIGQPGELFKPVDVAVNGDGSRIYVIDNGGIDTDRHRVVAYDAEGKKLFTIGKRGSGEGEFNLPTHGAVGPDGTLYVLDAGNFRVQAFDSDGRFLRTWGSAGSGYGQFARPRGIAVDRDGNVYVSDARFGNVQIFNSQGQLLLPIGHWSLEDKPGQYALMAGVAVDETGRIYVVDQRMQKVEVIERLTEAEGHAIMQAAGL